MKIELQKNNEIAVSLFLIEFGHTPILIAKSNNFDKEIMKQIIKQFYVKNFKGGLFKMYSNFGFKNEKYLAKFYCLTEEFISSPKLNEFDFKYYEKEKSICCIV